MHFYDNFTFSMSIDTAKSVRWLLLISLFFHLWTAYWSSGCHHVDEHYQVLEFANFKLGLTRAEDLPWEFGSRVRPWFLPGLFYIGAKGWQNLGVDNPFIWAHSFRTFSALLGWLAILGLVRLSGYWIRSRGWQLATALGFSFWFIPYLHSRTSSESWSGSLFWLAFAAYFVSSRGLMRPWISFAVGILMGLAMECRFQVAFMVLGFLSWIFFLSKENRHSIIPIVGGIFLVRLLGMGIDYWGYGNWVFAPFNYFKVNIWEGRAAQFGEKPWWFYGVQSFVFAVPPLSFLLIASVATLWICFPFHPLTWALLPFFLVHSFIGHKELRFLFPLVLGAVFSIGIVGEWLKYRVPRWAVQSALVFNGVLLFIVGSLPARTEMWVFERVFRKNLPIVFTTIDPPFQFSGMPIYFYRPRSLEFHTVSSSSELENILNQKGQVWLLQKEGETLKQKAYCRKEVSTYPSLKSGWGKEILKKARVLQWNLYLCSRKTET